MPYHLNCQVDCRGMFQMGKIRPTRRRRPPARIAEREPQPAWNRFAAILCEQSPHLSTQLPHHLEHVLNLAEKGADWQTYDRKFRKKVSAGEASWGEDQFNLYMKAHLEPQPGGKSSMRAATAPETPPKGSCFRFHTHGWCEAGPRCMYSHKCYTCLGNHPALQCTSRHQREHLMQARFNQPTTTIRPRPEQRQPALEHGRLLPSPQFPRGPNTTFGSKPNPGNTAR